MTDGDALFNPFPGLRPFDFDENHLFFGRDGQSDELLGRLRRQRFLALVGTSGSGKSSLVRAGLLPDVYGGFMVEAGSSWRVALFKPGNNPIGNLAAALSEPNALGPPVEGAVGKHIVEMTLRRCALGLGELAREARMEGNLLIIVDQFEEVFRFQKASTAEHPEDEATAFVKLLLEGAQQSDVPIYIALTMRSDYLGDCAQFCGLPEAINEGLYLIPRMTRDQHREAITGPVAVGGGEIAPRLVNRLLNDVGDNPDQLPILQHALMRTWDCWQKQDGRGPIDLPHYEQIGTMAGALSQQADEAYNELTPSGQELAQRTFKCLTEKGADNREARRPCTLKELIEVTGGTEEELKAVIETFRKRAFLMPSADKALTSESIIDISHESLIRGWGKLRDWVDEEASSAEFYGRIAKAARLHKEGSQGLWRDPELQLALNWEKGKKPTGAWAARYHSDLQGALEFLNQSQASRDAELAERNWQRNIQRALAIAIMVILALACGVSAVLLNQAKMQKQKADEAARVATRQSKIARAESLRVRKQNLSTYNTVIFMADRLLESAKGDEAAFWHSVKGGALSGLGRNSEAIVEFDAVLEIDPLNLPARAGNVYYHNTQGAAKQALEATEAVLKNGYKHWLVYQNLGHTLGLLGRYDEGEKSLRESNDKFIESSDEFSETHVSPDIFLATRRRVLVTGGRAARDANYYGIANLRAYSGNPSFPQALEEACNQTSPEDADAALTALNWAWMHFEQRPRDYGALIAAAALWERAQLPGWAKKYYEQFEEVHREKADRRYDRLAEWAAGRLEKLRSCRDALADRPDAESLAQEAAELSDRKEYKQALKSIDDAIALDAGNVLLLLQRAEISYLDENFADTKRDCDAILEKAPRTSRAYFLRGLAINRLRASAQEVEKEFRRAVEYDKADGESMIQISDLVARRDLNEALEWLERSRHAKLNVGALPWVYFRVAMIHLAEKRLSEAKQSIETAISLKRDEPAYYDLRAGIERSGDANETDVVRRLCEGYVEAGDIRSRLQRDSEAFSLYWASVEQLASLRKSGNQRELNRDIASVVSKISSVIESIESKAKAQEFWRTAVESSRWNEIRELFENEATRLSAAR
jgi:tetratricopeptide (TPR) repeat protein/energy-coupling factor transporter ATP-binding protein EcfA2